MWRLFCDFFLFTLVLYMLAATFWFCFTCDPPHAQWELHYRGMLEEQATCIDTTLWGNLFNIAHVVQGVLLLVSPVVILWKVKMDIRKKVRLFFIWGCGLLAVLFGLMRMLDANFTADIFWSYTELLVWTTLDVTVGVVVISLPVLDAWLATGARKAMTKMGRTNLGVMSKSGYGNLDKNRSGFGSSTGTKSVITAGSRSASHARSPDHSLSEEAFPKKKKSSIELTILRTDEYAVRFSTVDEEEAGTYGAKSTVSPGNEKFHGVAL